MEDPVFTVLMPVNRSPELLPYAIESVLSQSESRFELFIVCDGAPRVTVEFARRASGDDPRVRVFNFAKGERHGEAHRHEALLEARGRFVAQLGDDDLWFPNFLAELSRLLAVVEFGGLLQPNIWPDGSVTVAPEDLADPKTRNRMLVDNWNFFGPSVAGYHLSAYRALPVGWSPAPAALYSDLHMWRKFLRCDGLRVGTRVSIQSLSLPASLRRHMSIEDRAAEQAVVAKRYATPAARANLRASALRSLVWPPPARPAWIPRRVWTRTLQRRAATLGSGE